MNKKAYKKPSMKVAHMESANIICQSRFTKFSLRDEEVQEWTESEETKPQGWGSQW